MESSFDFIQSLSSTLVGHSDTKVIFRSNLTPDITIDVSKMSSGDQPKEVVTSPSTGIMGLIRPQVTFSGRRFSKHIAPYGRPYKHFWVVAATALFLSGILGSKLAWNLCKKVPGR